MGGHPATQLRRLCPGDVRASGGSVLLVPMITLCTGDLEECVRGVTETGELLMSSVANALRQRDLELYVIINKATWLYILGIRIRKYVETAPDTTKSSLVSPRSRMHVNDYGLMLSIPSTTCGRAGNIRLQNVTNCVPGAPHSRKKVSTVLGQQPSGIQTRACSAPLGGAI